VCVCMACVSVCVYCRFSEMEKFTEHGLYKPPASIAKKKTHVNCGDARQEVEFCGRFSLFIHFLLKIGANFLAVLNAFCLPFQITGSFFSGNKRPGFVTDQPVNPPPRLVRVELYPVYLHSFHRYRTLHLLTFTPNLL